MEPVSHSAGTQQQARPRQALAWLFLIASVLGLLLSAFIASSSKDAQSASTPLLREKLPLLEDLGEIERTLLAIQTANYQYFAYSINRENYQQQCVALHRAFQQTLARLERAFPGDAGLDVIRAAHDNSVRQEPKLDAMMQAPAIDWDEARAILVEMNIDSGDIKSRLSALRHKVAASVVESSEATERSIARTVTLVGAYSVLIFVIALLVAYHIRARARAEAELAHNATHDIVTGRYNRRALEAHIAGLGGASRILAVIAVERFHRLVGTLGHEAADAALRVIAARIEAHTTALGAQLFRLDGANFALLYPPSDASAETILAAAREPIQVGQHELLIAVVCGLASYPADGDDAVTLLRSANTALEHAKRTQAHCTVFRPEFNARSAGRLALEAALGHAVERGELELHYQPQMDIASSRIVGAEALVRWRRDGKLVSPIDFIPIAEESGLIVTLGDWILREACRQAAEWQAAGMSGLVIAVNISARQFLDPHFFESVTRALADTGVAPSAIELEITESAIMQDPEGVAEELARLRGLGLALAIDDFGTGYSSLAYLKRFPLDKLKVDQSFVRQLNATGSAGDAAIVEAVVRLGQTLGLRVIAEGVETEEHLNILRRLGCDEIQGYWLSRPVPPADAGAFILSRSR
ncbi:MAG: bifunctional diguanylate cyclase/phosphodiesterase [Rhodocyclaceae bacterium]|nr:bifunctional diguanylate cyclase/phosphodiesterase [Rhodocyclaceae bacterium]